MDEPIESVLSGKRLEIARLQDLVVEEIYNYVQPDAVMYGGTAVWRCYGGGRFSEDIDIYVGKNFVKKFETAMRRRGVEITWHEPEFETHMRVSNGTVEVLVEASLSKPKSSIVQYEKIDGSRMTISALEVTDLLVRKMEAYEGRRYIRDIYDIFILTNKLDKNDFYVKSNLKPFLKKIKPPVDEHILKSLVYRGRADLTFKGMLEYLESWIK